MDFRQLSYFVAVAEERHLGRAAERLHLSQPPLTRHIKALESDLGVRLFIRTPRGMVLTEAGETLLNDARAILGMLRSAADRAQRSGSGQTGRLDVGLYGSATFGVVPQVLSRFKHEHPDVDVTLHYAQTPAQILALRQGRVLIVFERLLPKEADIEVELVAREPLMLAVSERHRLAKQKSVDIGSLRHETLRIGTAPAEAATAVELCRRHGFEPHFAPVASDVIMATLLASIGSDVALVPWSITHVQFPGVAYLPLKPRTGAFMDLHCFYLRNERSPLCAAMLETVRSFRTTATGTPTRSPSSR
jgi:DNA-binding transcriptional LysR family regulator